MKIPSSVRIGRIYSPSRPSKPVRLSIYPWNAKKRFKPNVYAALFCTMEVDGDWGVWAAKTLQRGRLLA